VRKYAATVLMNAVSTIMTIAGDVPKYAATAQRHVIQIIKL
jgi:hypothetical protein